MRLQWSILPAHSIRNTVEKHTGWFILCCLLVHQYKFLPSTFVPVTVNNIFRLILLRSHIHYNFSSYFFKAPEYYQSILSLRWQQDQKSFLLCLYDASTLDFVYNNSTAVCYGQTVHNTSAVFAQSTGFYENMQNNKRKNKKISTKIDRI